MSVRVCLITVVIAAAVVGLVLLSPLRATIGKARQDKSSSSLTLNTLGFPVEVALNEVEHGTDLDIRFMFLYVDASDFTEPNLSNLFATLAGDYQETQFLQITAYSDKEMLQRAIDRFRVFCGVVPEDQLPAKSGYFRAQYSRRDDAEFFDYSPDPEKPDRTRVWFRMPIPRPD